MIGLAFGLLSLLLSYNAFTVKPANRGTASLAFGFGLLALGILLLGVSGFYFRRRAKRQGVLGAIGRD